MVYTMNDIVKLMRRATAEENQQLAQILGMDTTRSFYAQEIVRELYWKYQTPLGFMTRDPSFDEICIDVAKRLDCKHFTVGEPTCWALLEKIVRRLWEKMLDEMPEEERERFVEKLRSEGVLSGAAVEAGFDWAKAGTGSALLLIEQLGGFTTYKLALIVTNQVTKALVGRGLSLAANAALVRGISIALGPVGWVLLLWGINDLLGTNYKVVIPAVLYIYCIYERLRSQGELPW